MNVTDDLFDVMLREELRALPKAVSSAPPIRQANWWLALRATPRRPRSSVRGVVVGVVIGFSAALSLMSGSVSPLAWSHTLSSALARCGSDFGAGHPLSCAAEFFRAPAATPPAANGGASHVSTPTSPGVTQRATTSPTAKASPPAGVVSNATPTPAPTSLSTPAATPVPTVTPAPVNLVSNPSFETTTMTGWGNDYATLTRTNIGTAPDGAWVLKVAFNSPGKPYFGASFDGVVTSSVAGATYHASAWMRATPGSTSADKHAQLVIREVSSTGTITYGVLEATFSSTFQQYTVSYVAKNSGSRIDVYMDENPATGQPDPTSGDSFDVDEVVFYKG